MSAELRALLCDRRGVSAVEYGVFGAIITLLFVSALPPLAAQWGVMISNLGAYLTP